MSYPAGTFAADQRSVTTKEATGIYSTAGPPKLRGSDPFAAYDRAPNRWIPTSFASISPDGRRYAWGEVIDYQTSSRIHVVDVATGSDKVVLSTGFFDEPAWEPEGLFVQHHTPNTDSSDGLWRVDPSTGVTTQLDSTHHNWSRFGFGAAWTFEYNSNATKAGGDTILRIDLSSGRVNTWVHQDGASFWVRGTDSAGHPVIQTSGLSGSQTLVLSTAPGQLNIQIYPQPGLSGNLVFEDVEADHGRLWLSESSGVYLYPPGGGITQAWSSHLGVAPSFTGGCH